MQQRWSRPQIAIVIGAFVGSIALAGSTAVALEKEDRGLQMQQSWPQGMSKPHTQAIEDRVERRLARSASLAGSDIQVTVEDRTVSLSGTVGSEQAKERALRLARRVRGVQEVKDELSVDQAAVDKRRNVEVGDEELAKQVAMKLADETFPFAEAEEEWFYGWEVDGYNWEFDVEVDEGVVTLEGDVDSYGDISKAIQAVRAVPGVRAVESALTVDRYDYPYYGYSYYYSSPFVLAVQNQDGEANTIVGTVSLVEPDSGIIWLRDKSDTRIKMVASPEEQLKGLEVGDRVEVRLEEQSVAGFPDSPPDRTVAGIIRKVDEGSKLLRIETTEGNIIDISPFNGLSSGMEAGERVQLAIHKK